MINNIRIELDGENDIHLNYDCGLITMTTTDLTGDVTELNMTEDEARFLGGTILRMVEVNK